MAFCRPNWLNTCARTATSPSHEGVEGTAVGAIWIWIEGCVILFLCLLSREKDVILIFPLLRRHNFGLSCQFPDDLPPTNPGYAISLRMSWAEEAQEQRRQLDLVREAREQSQEQGEGLG